MTHALSTVVTIASSQANGQWQTSNDADAAIANAIADILTVDFSGGNVTLTNNQFSSAMTFVPSGLSTTRNLTVPAMKRALFFVNNTDTVDTINVVRGSTTIAVAAGQIGAFSTDGTTNGLTGAVLATGGALSAATTTEALTGTDTSKYITADSLAALWEKGSDEASAGTVALGEGGFFHITGTTTITDIDWDTAKDGRMAWVVFDGALTLTHNGTTLQLPGGANITTAAGDRALFVQDAGDNVICLAYIRADATPILAAQNPVGKHTIWIPASAMVLATTSPPSAAQVETSSNKVNYSVLDFDASADEIAHFNVSFPKGWNKGTVTFQVIWTTTATDTDGVAWALEGVAVSDNEASDASWGTAVVVTDDAQSAAGEILVTAESSALTIGGSPADGDICFFRIYRDVSDANDDMTEDARLIGVKFFFTTNSANDA